VSAFFSVGLLIAIVGAMLTLPLIPALRELKEKSDATPLNVIQQNAGEVRHFADGFRAYLKGLDEDFQRCAAYGLTATGSLPDGTGYMVLGCADAPFPMRDDVCSLLLAACEDLKVPPGATFSRDIYAAGDFDGGENNHYRAILAEKSIRLGPSSHVTRWLHAVEELSAGPECTLLGRISSDRLVRLQRGCRFTRVHAPLIAAGNLENDRLAKLGNFAATQVASSTDRLLYDGDFAIEARDVIHANIVVRGTLSVGAGARVCGSLKSGKDMILEGGVRVEGSLISGERMHVGPDCSLYGPIIAERGMFLGSATVCGAPERPTTVTSPAIEVQEGALVFGTLWARESGRVVGRA
jgi:predicted acyltransferase (DUF342 family)